MLSTQMIIEIVGGLALFLYGMKVMSEGLQVVARERLRQTLGVMTGNRFLGVGTGLLVTTAVQSSSATTVMLVSFVHAGLLNLTQASGVIMGANIGTTVTGWLVALIGFRFKISALALPAIALGFFIRFIGAKRLTEWGNVLLGFGVLFLGLDFMKGAVGSLKEAPVIVEWIAAAHGEGFGSLLLAVGIGTFVTVIIQSSSATMAITMALAAQGMIDLSTACGLILGENIGTTITANLAAIGASRAAKRTARAHMLFNLIGVTWAILLFKPFLALVDLIIPGTVGAGGSQAVVADHMAGFHTAFNVINTLLFLPFVKQLAWLATRLVPDGAKSQPEEFQLRYLDTRTVPSAPLALQAARNELARMLRHVSSMLDKLLTMIAEPDQKHGKLVEEIQSSEYTVDRLETEIAEYMVRVARHDLSPEQSKEVAGILSAVSDIERMGDHCESLLKLLGRKYDEKLVFTDKTHQDLREIGGQVAEFLHLLSQHIVNPETNIMPRAMQIEESINEMRRTMRQEHVQRLNACETTVASGLVFIDMLTSFEKMGDHSYNVAQVLSGVR